MTSSRQAQFADQVQGRRLGGEETVGAGFDDAALHVLGLDDAAQARARVRRGWRRCRALAR